MQALIDTVSSVILNEARRKNLEYKEKLVKEKLDRVIVELEGKDSEKFTKLAGQYARTKKHIEKLQQVQEAINTKIKDNAIELFDAEDEVLTRVVETVALTVTVSKKPVAGTSSKTDYEKILEELIKLQPELDTKIQELTRQFTTIKTTPPKDVSLRVDIKESVGDVINKIKEKLKSFLGKIKSWGTSYDERLDKIKKMM